MSNNKDLDSPKKQRIKRERKHRRNDIIKVAESFFINQGYDQTMVDEIAKKAGYTKATIYNYFESKDELFIAVASNAFEQLFRVLETTMSQPEVKYELRSLGDAYVIFVDKYPGYAGLFTSGQLSLLIGNMIKKEETNQNLTEIEKKFRHHQRNIEELMTNVILETMKEAGIQDSLDPFSVIMALSTLGSAIRELVIRGKTSNQPDNKSKEYLNVLFNIIDKGLKHYND